MKTKAVITRAFLFLPSQQAPGLTSMDLKVEVPCAGLSVSCFLLYNCSGLHAGRFPRAGGRLIALVSVVPKHLQSSAKILLYSEDPPFANFSLLSLQNSFLSNTEVSVRINGGKTN